MRDWSKLDMCGLAVENSNFTRDGGVSDLLQPHGYRLKNVFVKDWTCI
ncbi:MAG: hypothetical protein VXZ82_00250 [Planctomycetota bacterium]|nr:hypothetical protein [Planctomycetota bacterium]